MYLALVPSCQAQYYCVHISASATQLNSASARHSETVLTFGCLSCGLVLLHLTCVLAGPLAPLYRSEEAQAVLHRTCVLAGPLAPLYRSEEAQAVLRRSCVLAGPLAPLYRSEEAQAVLTQSFATESATEALLHFWFAHLAAGGFYAIHMFT